MIFGKTKPGGINEKTVQISEWSDLPINRWGVEDVTAWLRSIDRKTFSEYVSKFREQYIDGPALLELTDSELQELVPKLGHRKTIFRKLKNLILSSS